MIDKQKVKDLALEWLEGKEYFLVDATVDDQNKITVEIDHKDGVWIEDCCELSRFIEDHFDRDVEDFELSVMSYGLTGALKLDRQLQKYVGKDVEVKTKEQGKLQGKLVAFDAEKVEILPAPKKSSKKKLVEEPVNLTLDRKTTGIKPAIIF